MPVFDFTNLVPNAGRVAQTVDGYTVTASTNSAGLSATGNQVTSTDNQNQYIQFDFSSAVDVSSFKVGFTGNSGTITGFTITGGDGTSTWTYSQQPTYNDLYTGSAPAYTVDLSGANDWAPVTWVRVARNGAGTVSFVADTIEFTPPPTAVQSIVRAGTEAANATSVTFRVTFNRDVTGVSTSSFEVMSLTGGVSGVVGGVTSVSGSEYLVTVDTLSGEGTVRLALKESSGVQGAGGGSVAGYTGAAALAVDTVAPAAPSTPDLAAASDTGSSDTDNITSNLTPTFTGTAESGSTVRLYLADGTLLASAAATAGAWSITPTLGAGTHSITARATDAAGNQGPASAALSVTIDTTAPATQVSTVTFSADTGASGTDLITSTAAQTLEGALSAALAADERVEVSLDNGSTWGAATAASGATTWSFATTLAGSNTLKVRVVDAAGNAGPELSRAYVLDAVAPAAPSTPDLADASDAGSSSTDNLTHLTAVTINGTAEAGAAITLYAEDGTTVLGSGTATGGSWSIGVTLAAGTNVLKARAVDAAGNASPLSDALTVTVDTQAPGLPTVAVAADTGVAGDGITRTATINVSGLEDGASWSYSLDGGASWLAGTGGSFAPTADGTYHVQVRQTDAAGNTSAATTAFSFTLDTAAAAPTAALAADTGSSGTDRITSNATVQVTGLESGASWEYSLDGGATWTAGAGTSLDLPADGAYDVRVRQTDVAGNVSAASGALAVTLDTSAPTAAPTLALATDTGANALDRITSVGDVDVTGLDAGATWQYSLDEGATWTAGTGSRLSLTGDGDKKVQVRQLDAAGNAGPASATFTLTLDTTAPVLKPADSTPAAGATGAAVSGALVLRFDEASLASDVDGSKVVLHDGVTDLPVAATVTVGADGRLQIQPTGALAYDHPYYVTWEAGAFRDAAGNAVAVNASKTLLDFRTQAAPADDPAPPAPPAPPVTPQPGQPPASGTIDGVDVETQPVTLPGGGQGHVVTIPVVVPGRQELSGEASLADIPLAQNAAGGSLLLAQLPVGYGLSASGGAAAPASDSLLGLIAAIQARTEDGSSDQEELSAGGREFLTALGHEPVLVQTIVLSAGAGAPPAGPVVLRGAPDGAAQPALVIDTAGTPGLLELHDVAFAAIVGAATVTGGTGSQFVVGDASAQTIILGADDDILFGGGGDDVIGSAGGNDRLYGEEGDDTLFGGEGDDWIDGGTGRDVVLLAGSQRAEYAMRSVNGQLQLTHRDGGVDGVDTIAHVEVLQFAAPAAGSAHAQLARLYQAVLGRAPDADGERSWLAQHAAGRDMKAIGADLLASPEGAAQAPADDAAFVAGLYERALGRQPDAAGQAFWLAELQSGGMDRAGVALALIDSAEAQARPLAPVALDFQYSDPATLVRLYGALFGRKADEAGLNFWLAHREAGASEAQVAQWFLGAVEATPLAALDDRAFVQWLYTTGLQRAGSDKEVDDWTGQLLAGGLTRGEVALGVANSAEMVGLVGTVTTTLETFLG